MRRYDYLPQFTGQYKCQNIMEIGVWSGQTGRNMVVSAQNSGVIGVSYHGFDLFEEFIVDEENGDTKVPPPFEEVRDRLNVAGVFSNLYKGDSKVTVPKFIEENPNLKMDLIFIDGGHSLENIKTDWNNVQPLIYEKTVIVFDDYWLPELSWGSNQIVNNLDNKKWDVEVLPNYDNCIWQGKDCKLSMVKVTQI